MSNGPEHVSNDDAPIFKEPEIARAKPEADSLKLEARVKLELACVKVRAYLELLRSSNRALENAGIFPYVTVAKRQFREILEIYFGASGSCFFSPDVFYTLMGEVAFLAMF